MARQWYGSITNRCEEGKIYGDRKDIYVGMGVTDYLWSDRHTYEVTKVFDQNHICIRRMEAKVVKGSCFDGSAEYEYSSNHKNKEIEIKKFKDGWYELTTKENGRRVKYGSGYHLSFGVLDEYYDPCF